MIHIKNYGKQKNKILNLNKNMIKIKVYTTNRKNSKIQKYRQKNKPKKFLSSPYLIVLTHRIKE